MLFVAAMLVACARTGAVSPSIPPAPVPTSGAATPSLPHDDTAGVRTAASSSRDSASATVVSPPAQVAQQAVVANMGDSVRLVSPDTADTARVSAVDVSKREVEL